MGGTWGKKVRASPGSGVRLLDLSRCLCLQQDLGLTATSTGPKSSFKVAGFSRREYAGHTWGPSMAVWTVPACNSTKGSLLGVPIVSTPNPHLRGCQALDPHPQDIEAPTQKSGLLGPAPSWRSHQGLPEQAVLRGIKEAVQKGGDGS